MSKTNNPKTWPEDMSRMHELKTWSDYFEAIWEGRKTFEVRVDDRGFKVGDLIHLREWVPCANCSGTGREWDNGDHTQCGMCLGKKTTRGFTGREMTADVIYILASNPAFGVKEGFVVMSIVVRQRATTSGRHPHGTA